MQSPCMNSSTAAAADKQNSLLSLPTELRMMIYTALIEAYRKEPAWAVIVYPCKKCFLPTRTTADESVASMMLNLALTCRAVRDDAVLELAYPDVLFVFEACPCPTTRSALTPPPPPSSERAAKLTPWRPSVRRAHVCAYGNELVFFEKVFGELDWARNVRDLEVHFRGATDPDDDGDDERPGAKPDTYWSHSSNWNALETFWARIECERHIAFKFDDDTVGQDFRTFVHGMYNAQYYNGERAEILLAPVSDGG